MGGGVREVCTSTVPSVMQSCICNHTSHVAEYVCPSATVLPLTGFPSAYTWDIYQKSCDTSYFFQAQGPEHV